MSSTELHGLEHPLGTHPLRVGVADCLVRRLWEPCGPDEKANPDLASYVEDYSSRCRRFARDGGINVSVRRHDEIIHISRMILNDSSREEIRGQLDPSYRRRNEENAKSGGGNETVDASIDLCASLLAMVDVGEHDFGYSGGTALAWSDVDGSSFRQCLAGYFTPQTALDVDNPRLSKLFTVRNLARIGGIRVRWTTNLVDHLLLTDDDESVFVFRCAGFLKLQQSCREPLFAAEFISETLRTLSLLCPQNDAQTSRWLSAQDASLLELGQCGSLRAHERRLDGFRFWRDRLVILRQAFDESRPRTLGQWWADRRNGVQWYTFWVAVLVFVMTMVFGIVQTAEGALQVYVGFRQLQQAP